MKAFLSDRARLLLTAAVAAHRPKIEAGYDVKEVASYLDYINLMAYDYHGFYLSKSIVTFHQILSLL